jgi:hypothetical protein
VARVAPALNILPLVRAARLVVRRGVRRLALIGLLGCERPYVISDTTPRTSVRPEAIGCWALVPDVGRRPTVDAELTPPLVQLDTAIAEASSRGVRRVLRRDRLGQPVLRDAEGFSFLDTWTADSTTDSIRLALNNGLYGSRWALALPVGRGLVDTIRGLSRGFGDSYPPPDYPVRSSLATRVECTTAHGPVR